MKQWPLQSMLSSCLHLLLLYEGERTDRGAYRFFFSCVCVFKIQKYNNTLCLLSLQCLVAFVDGSDTDMAIQSIDKLKLCADYLAKGDLEILPPVSHDVILIT